MTRAAPKFTEALAAFQSGRNAEAERLARAILAVQPDHSDAWQLLGLIAQASGRKALAVEALGRVAALRAGDPLAWCNLGESKRRLGDLDGAVMALERSIELNPNLPEAHFNLANVLYALGPTRFEEAAHHYERAVALRPHFAKALYNYGNLKLERGLSRGAVDLFRRAVALQPEWIDARVNLAVSLELDHAWNEAEAAWTDVLKRDPGRLEARESLGMLKAKRGDVAGGVAEFDRLIEDSIPRAGADRRTLLELWLRRLRRACLIETVTPDDAYADQIRAELDATLDRIGPCPRLPEGEEGDRIGLVEPPMFLAYHARDDRRLWEKFQAAYDSALPDHDPPNKPAGGPVRLGVVVTHGHEGVFAQCAGPLVARLACDGLEVAIACVSGARSWLLERLGPPATSLDWILLPRGLRAAAQTLRAAKLDVVWYWESGTDALNHFLPLLRPAPRQYNGWGWPMTCGHRRMTGFLTCRGLDPSPESDAFFTEPLARLASAPTYFLRSAFDRVVLPEAGAFGIDPHTPLITCLQRPLKLQPEFDQVAATILQAVPNARLMVTADVHPRVNADLKARMARSLGDAIDRVVFLPSQDRPNYLGWLARASLALDPIGYGGGANTTYDAVGVGTPVVTRPGRFHRGRWAVMTLERLGMNELVGDDPATIAVSLLGQPERLRTTRARLNDRAELLWEDPKVIAEHRDLFLNGTVSNF